MQTHKLITQRSTLLGRELTFKRFYKYRRKKLLDAYLFWIFLGGFAGHWFYLGRYTEAIVYIVVMVVLGINAAMTIEDTLTLFWILMSIKAFELLYMPFLVKNTNAKIYQDLREEFGLSEEGLFGVSDQEI